MILAIIGSIVTSLLACFFSAKYGYRLGNSDWWNKRLLKKVYKKWVSDAKVYKELYKDLDSQLKNYNSDDYWYKRYSEINSRIANVEHQRDETLREMEELKKVHAKDLTLSHQALEAVRANASVLAEKLAELERNNVIDK